VKFENTSAIVTGAASGLGAATAQALLQGGVRVIGIDLAAGIEKAGDTGIEFVAADVTDGDQVSAAVQVAASDPSAPLRIAISCAGIAPSMRTLDKTGAHHDLALYRKVIEINLVGTFSVMAIAAESIAKTEPGPDGQRGVIINTASVAAFEGQIGQVAYGSSKGGVHAMTIPAARDLSSSGIRVCTIAPGIVDTPMLATISEEFRASLAAGVPFPKRLCRPDEYAQLAMMIIGHDYLNGETIRMDGALRMAPR
jgi:NAD(P)-dependent dehydrogenase (short-subunit alcohol dehydrogenase family)